MNRHFSQNVNLTSRISAACSRYVLERVITSWVVAEFGRLRVAHQVENATFDERLKEVVSDFCDGFELGISRGYMDDEEFSCPSSFALEGVGMAIGLKILCSFAKGEELLHFIEKNSSSTYTIHVGVGWAMSFFPERGRELLAFLSPDLRMLAFDGWGFRARFLSKRSTATILANMPHGLNRYERRSWVSGVGRALWFSERASSSNIAESITNVSADYQVDLWSGVGLAAVFAAGSDTENLNSLLKLSGEYRSALIQGAIFGAEAAFRYSEVSDSRELSSSVLTGRTVASNSSICREAKLEVKNAESDGHFFEEWRRLTRDAASYNMWI